MSFFKTYTLFICINEGKVVYTCTNRCRTEQEKKQEKVDEIKESIYNEISNLKHGLKNIDTKIKATDIKKIIVSVIDENVENNTDIYISLRRELTIITSNTEYNISDYNNKTTKAILVMVYRYNIDVVDVDVDVIDVDTDFDHEDEYNDALKQIENDKCIILHDTNEKDILLIFNKDEIDTDTDTEINTEIEKNNFIINKKIKKLYDVLEQLEYYDSHILI